MYSDNATLMCLLLSLALVATSEAFFLKWGSDTTRSVPVQVQKPWGLNPAVSPYRYQYSYAPYEPRKVYPIAPAYAPEPANMAPIPISVPAGASLTPVSLQHVQLVPCMCPVAPEEADKLHDQLGAGPYLAQTYAPAGYSVPQQIAVATDNKATTKQ